MMKLKFIKNSPKKYKLNYIFMLKSTKKKNFNILGKYIPSIKLYILKYPNIIFSLKLGYNHSKQSYLLSLFYLKKILEKNL